MGNPDLVNNSPEILDKIELGLNQDCSIATLKINIPQNELAVYDKEKLLTEIFQELKDCGIVYGVKKELFNINFEAYKEYVIAEGLKPVDGEDSITKMYEIVTANPVVGDDDKADFYDVKLINRVKSGDWLGERLDETKGAPGQSVRGEIICQKVGIKYPLNYEKETVMEFSFNNKTILYAKIDGVVCYNEKNIFVSNYVEINGDVGYETGNIEFEGFVTVKGTVCDGFSVIATKDIEILGNMGVGNIKKIQSLTGSVFIKGGIAAKEKVEVKAAKNFYSKFLQNCDVVCGGIAHIGYYAISCSIEAKEILVDSGKGKIIGGVSKAQLRVVAPTLGSESEKKTIVVVEGIDKDDITEKIRLLESKIEDKNIIKSTLEQTVNNSNVVILDSQYNEAISELYFVTEELSDLVSEKIYLTNFLKVRGNGEVKILKKVFPGVKISIGGIDEYICAPTLAATYFVQDEQITKT